MTTRLKRQPRPMVTSGSSTAWSITQNEWMRTLLNNTELLTMEPDTMQPPDTMVLMAWPCLPSASCTNLAGGNWRWLVQMGQLVS